MVRCGGLERTHFEQFLLWEGVVVLKELILNSFYLKELILNSFYFGRVWWSWKNSFWTVSTLGGCGGLERTHFEQFLLKRTDFEQFLLWEGVVTVLKELLLNSFYFGRVWWSWKNWFWTVSTVGGCGGLEGTHFEQFLLWEGVAVLKELILKSFYLKELILKSFFFGRVWWSWKNCSLNSLYFVRCGGLERIDFEQIVLWEGVVVLKELILNSFYFGRVCWSWKNSFWRVST